MKINEQYCSFSEFSFASPCFSSSCRWNLVDASSHCGPGWESERCVLLGAQLPPLPADKPCELQTLSSLIRINLCELFCETQLHLKLRWNQNIRIWLIAGSFSAKLHWTVTLYCSVQVVSVPGLCLWVADFGLLFIFITETLKKQRRVSHLYSSLYVFSNFYSQCGSTGYHSVKYTSYHFYFCVHVKQGWQTAFFEGRSPGRFPADPANYLDQVCSFFWLTEHTWSR